MLSFSEADKEKLNFYEEQNKILKAKWNEQDEQLKRLLVQIQNLESKLQLKARQLKIATSPFDVSARQQQESRLEAEIREQQKIKENLEREVSILKHAPQLAASRRQAGGRHGAAQKDKKSHSSSTKPASNFFSVKNEEELRKIVSTLREELETSKQRHAAETAALESSKEESLNSGKPNREAVSVLKIQLREADLQIKTLEDREEQTVLALRAVKENDYRLVSEVDSLASQLASQKAYVSSEVRQKQARKLRAHCDSCTEHN